MKIKLCCSILLLFTLAGCGSDAPVAPSSPVLSPLQEVKFSYIKESEFGAYLRAIARMQPDFQMIIDEQTVLFEDWASGRTNVYWTRVYANNLFLRIRAYARNAAAIRLTNPELIQLNGQLLKAMDTLAGAIQDFSVAVDPPDDSIIDQANEKIAQFNVAIDRYSQQLSDFAGQPISLF